MRISLNLNKDANLKKKSDNINFVRNEEYDFIIFIKECKKQSSDRF